MGESAMSKSALEREVAALRRRLDMKIHSTVITARPGDILVLRPGEQMTTADMDALRSSLASSGLNGVHVIRLPPDGDLRRLPVPEVKRLRKFLGARRRKR